MDYLCHLSNAIWSCSVLWATLLVLWHFSFPISIRKLPTESYLFIEIRDQTYIEASTIYILFICLYAPSFFWLFQCGSSDAIRLCILAIPTYRCLFLISFSFSASGRPLFMIVAFPRSLQKKRLFKYIENFTSKNWKFLDDFHISDIFHSFA